MKLISIIIPVYNAEEYIGKCIHSIIDNNDTSEIEIICVDDGSQDRSGMICDDFSSRYPNIHVIHKENGGVSSARNTGLSVAQGDYIAWIDSDDYVEEEWLSNVLTCIKEKNMDCLVMDYALMYGQNRIAKQSLPFLGGNVSLSDYVYELSSEKSLHSYLVIHIMKREFYYKNKFDISNMIFEDYAFMTKVALNFRSIFYLKKALYNYVQSSNSLVRNNKFSIEKGNCIINNTQCRYRIFSEKGFSISKAGYWQGLFYAYNQFTMSDPLNKLIKKIRFQLFRDTVKIFITKDLDRNIKIKIFMIVGLPNSVYKYIYQKYKGNN